MSCIIDQCYVCQSTINFSTYAFPCVISSLTIRLTYDLFHLFHFFLLKHERKEINKKGSYANLIVSDDITQGKV